MSVQRIYFEMLNKMVKKMTRSEQNEGVEDEKNKGISVKKKIG